MNNKLPFLNWFFIQLHMFSILEHNKKFYLEFCLISLFSFYIFNTKPKNDIHQWNREYEKNSIYLYLRWHCDLNQWYEELDYYWWSQIQPAYEESQTWKTHKREFNLETKDFLSCQSHYWVELTEVLKLPNVTPPATLTVAKREGFYRVTHWKGAYGKLLIHGKMYCIPGLI